LIEIKKAIGLIKMKKPQILKTNSKNV